MSIIHFRLTDEKPRILFGGSSLQFTKMVLRMGEIDELQFELSWKATDPLNPQSKILVSHSFPFNPMGYIVTNLPPSDTVYEFRKNTQPPVVNFETNLGGVLLSAFSESNKPFDLDMHMVINHFARIPV
ncbi:MAG: hypothetical protein ABIQ40_10905 [Bacteroidia bacterium]